MPPPQKKKNTVFNKYRDWNCIYKDRNEQRMKRWFSSKYMVSSKSVENEVVPLDIQYTYSSEFFIGWSTPETYLCI